ncbi:MAG: DUF4391 domain-containing protein [bacterium]|nr:DUF4391 domain-containing protein [bacterium]
MLYHFPTTAKFDRVLNKERFYAGVRNNRKLKQLFTDQVTRIRWTFKLSPDTINITASDGVPEIEVIQIDAATTDLAPAVLLAIDRAIPNPTLHEIHAEGQVRLTAAYKRSSESDKNATVIGDYLTSDWHTLDGGQCEAARVPLPVSLNLGSLYATLLRSMIDSPTRNGERLRDHVDRHSQIMAARRDAAKITKKMHAENQLNRKVEWNAKLRAINQTIAQLTQETSQEADA